MKEEERRERMVEEKVRAEVSSKGVYLMILGFIVLRVNCSPFLYNLVVDDEFKGSTFPGFDVSRTSHPWDIEPWKHRISKTLNLGNIKPWEL